MSDDDLRVPETYWEEPLLQQELNAKDQEFIKDQLGLELFGYRKPEEYIIGSRVLYEEDGYADLLLMRRDFAQSGFSFDLDVTLGRITGKQSQDLRQQVRDTIKTISTMHPREH